MKTNNTDVASLTIAILSKEIIRLKSLCLKASEHIVVGDDETLNLKDALNFKTSPDYTVDYVELQKESILVAKELKAAFGSLESLYGDYMDILKQKDKDGK